MNSGLDPRKIIVALDYDNERDALALVDSLGEFGCRFKIGKEMFTRFGPAFVKKLTQQKLDVFLDLKFHDIPNTVKKACLSALELGVWMVNVHALGGRKMLEASVEALKDSKAILLAVTVLTSLDDADLKEIGVRQTVSSLINDLVALSKESGLDGVVCSPHDVREIKAQCGNSFLAVTPGIRLERSEGDCQKRSGTPKEALSEGSDFLVIGRPITKALNPKEMFLKILNG